VVAESQSGRLASGRRTIGGAFDIAGANRAFDLLRREKLYGSLTITDGLQDLCAFFTRGGLRVLASGRPLPTLRGRLLEQEKLSQEDAAQLETQLADARASQSGGKLIDERELLIAQGFKPQELDQVASSLIEDVLLGCLLWEGADFELRTGEPNQEVMSRRDLDALTLSIGVDKLIEHFKSRVRQVKDVRATVPSARALVQPTAEAREVVDSGKAPIPGPEGRMFAKLLREIVNEPGSSVRHLALRSLAGEVVMAKRLQLLSNAGLVKLTRARLDQKAELERLREMEESLDQALSQLMRRVCVAKVAAEQGEGQRAARHMARAGGLLLEEGRSDEATRTFNEALGHAEDDLEAREGLVQSLWATGRQDEAAAQSEELGKRYLELNLPGRARRVLEKALGFKEETSTLQLLVSSLVKLDRGGAAAEAGERLINRLRREGKLDEARTLAEELMQVGDEAARQKLARAAGVDRVKVAILVVFALVFGATYFFANQINLQRDEYRLASREASGGLQNSRSLEEFEGHLQKAISRLEGFNEPGEIADKAAAATERLRAVQKDCHLARELSGLLPWREHTNLDSLRIRVDELAGQIKSPALGGPLGQLRRELTEFFASFEARQRQLRELAAGKPTGAELESVFELGKATRQEFRALPERLYQVYIPVLVETTPPGASIVVDKAPYETKTPVHVNVSLRGPLPIELSLAQHKPVKVELLFDSLEGPVVQRALTPIRREVPIGEVRVHLKKAITKRGKLSSRYSQLSVGKDSRYFGRIKLDKEHQAYVYPHHEIKGDAIYLVGVSVKLWKRVGKRWSGDRSRSLEVPRVRRPTQTLGRVLHVKPLSKTPGLDHAALVDKVRQLIAERIKEGK
jgi:tetratricopeptide (TPR) repeat protein